MQAVTAVTPISDWVEEPSPVSHGAVAEVMTNGGAGEDGATGAGAESRLSPGPNTKVFLRPGATDLRRGYEGLTPWARTPVDPGVARRPGVCPLQPESHAAQIVIARRHGRVAVQPAARRRLAAATPSIVSVPRSPSKKSRTTPKPVASSTAPRATGAPSATARSFLPRSSSPRDAIRCRRKGGRRSATAAGTATRAVAPANGPPAPRRARFTPRRPAHGAAAGPGGN